jgi:hypothetical protein
MTQQEKEGNTAAGTEDKLDPQAPGRREMQPPIHTHPPDAMDAAAAEKVAGPGQPEGDPDAPRHVSTAVGSGPAMDPQVGGAGLGMPPADASDEAPANTRDRDIRAEDRQVQNAAGADTPAAAGEPGESPAPRKEGEQTRDVLIDEVNQDQAPTQQEQQQQQQQQQQNAGGSPPPAGERSESLLPKVEGDETPEVAEEVSLDQQSDRVRELGNLPGDDIKTPAGSVAGTVAGTLGDTLAGRLSDQGQHGTPDGDNTAPRE